MARGRGSRRPNPYDRSDAVRIEVVSPTYRAGSPPAGGEGAGRNQTRNGGSTARVRALQISGNGKGPISARDPRHKAFSEENERNTSRGRSEMSKIGERPRQEARSVSSTTSDSTTNGRSDDNGNRALRCKSRPTAKRGGGGGRPFIPWCR